MGLNTNTTGVQQGTITTQNVGAPTGNNVTANSTVAVALDGQFDTATIQTTGTFTGVLTVQITVDNNLWVTVSGAQTLTNAASGAQTATIASGIQGIWQLDVSGIVGVRVTALAAVTGTATVSIVGGTGSGVMGIDTPVTIAAGAAAIGTVATPAGSAINFLSTASTNLTNQKASAGNLFEVTVSNPTPTPAYVKFYSKATAPVVASDLPIMTIVAPATSATGLPSQINLNFGQIGKRFVSGISMAITGGPTATDATNAVAGVQVHGTYI